MHFKLWMMLAACLAIATLKFNAAEAAITITAYNKHNNKPVDLEALEEDTVYRALTLVEGDILVDKYCECLPEHWCRAQARNVIVLTR